MEVDNTLVMPDRGYIIPYDAALGGLQLGYANASVALHLARGTEEGMLRDLPQSDQDKVAIHNHRGEPTARMY